MENILLRMRQYTITLYVNAMQGEIAQISMSSVLFQFIDAPLEIIYACKIRQ